MVRKFGVLAAVLSLAACATRPVSLPPPPPPPGMIPSSPHAAATDGTTNWIGERCAPTSPCAPKEKSPYRQYYDAHHRRYYYYDPLKRRYFWENGQPKA